MPPMSPLLLFDLDNTLVNRNQAFQGWAMRFLSERALPPGDLRWFTTLDCGGYLDRAVLIRAAVDRYGLSEPIDDLLEDYRTTVTELIACPADHLEALRLARTEGWVLGIVSNGATEQQWAKIRRTGLDELVDGCTVSEEAGCAKPDPRIFHLAAERCGMDTAADWTASAWMVGDHAPADIAGAAVSGMRSVWIDHGRSWGETGYRPTLTARNLPEAVALVLAEEDLHRTDRGRYPRGYSWRSGSRPGNRSGPGSGGPGGPGGLPRAVPGVLPGALPGSRSAP